MPYTNEIQRNALETVPGLMREHVLHFTRLNSATMVSEVLKYETLGCGKGLQHTPSRGILCLSTGFALRPSSL